MAAAYWLDRNSQRETDRQFREALLELIKNKTDNAKDKLKPEDHERFVNAVLNGKRQMPPWRGALADDQIEAIWAYIRATVDK